MNEDRERNTTNDVEERGRREPIIPDPPENANRRPPGSTTAEQSEE